MTDPLPHFLELQSKINARLRALGSRHSGEQILTHTWLFGALGAVPAEAMFICESPSLTPVRRLPVPTIDGGLPDIEAQWWGGPRNPAAKRFRVAIARVGLKESPWDVKGGWRCYITNVIKEANYASDQQARGKAGRLAQARNWAEILRWEVGQVRPRHVFTVGAAADDAVVALQREGQLHLPPFSPHRILHYSARGRGRGDAEVITAIERGIRDVLD